MSFLTWHENCWMFFLLFVSDLKLNPEIYKSSTSQIERSQAVKPHLGKASLSGSIDGIGKCFRW